MDAVRVGGREFSASVLSRIDALVRETPDLTRAGLAREVCGWLSWRQPNGKLSAASCRSALVQLERRGAVRLPEATRSIVRSQRVDARPSLEPAAQVSCSLADLGIIELVPITGCRTAESRLWNELIATHHYCGYQPLVGAQIRYLVRCEVGWLGALGFSAASRHVRDRDRWIGWSVAARGANRRLLVANSRFLLLPWVQVANLASRVLALAAARLPGDWQEKYSYQPLLLETYVEDSRFSGTCYQAANWQRVGCTAGRGRQDRARTQKLPVKSVYVYPLATDCREQMCREPLKPRRPCPADADDESDWAAREFAGARLGDCRLQRRLVHLVQDFYARPQANVPQACGTRAKTKAAYRLLDHDQLTLPQLLQAHCESTVERLGRHAVVLAVQDTTSLNYNSHHATEGLGLIGARKDGAQGLLLHDTMAFTTEGLPLGLLAAQVWVRPPEEFGKKAQRKQLPIEQKESFKWLASFHAAAAAQRELAYTQVVSVGDREADLYELFQLAVSRADHPQLLIRAEHDRLVADGHQRLWQTVLAQEVAGYQDVAVSRRPGHAARVARMAVRFAEVELCPPKNRHQGTTPVRAWAVLAQELEPPPLIEPREWMLLTTRPVNNGEEAAEKLRWYAQRWQIEVYHRTLKSGCRVEQRQLATVRRLENCLAIDMVVAWRIFHLTRLGRETPDLPCTVYFDDLQWQALHGFIHRNPDPPDKPPSLRQAIRMVASLGGFLGRKGDGEPGTQSIWLGLQRLDDIAAAWQIFRLARSP